MITFETTITFSAGAAIGALVMKIIDHRLAKGRTEEDRRIKGVNQDATKFRSTVINELAGLYPIPVNWPDDIGSRLNATFPIIQAAVEEFKPFVTDRATLDKAWLQYYTHCKEVIPNTFSLANRLYGTKNTQEARDEFKHNVDTLLSFAKEK